MITTLAFSPDGTLVATAGWDKMVRVWPVDRASFLPLEPRDLRAWMDDATTAVIDESTNEAATPGAKP
jgi:WD40 repeat protein